MADPPRLTGVEGSLALVRHGESTWVAEGRFQGQQDPPLSALGERQAALVGGAAARPGGRPALPLPASAPIGIWHSTLQSRGVHGRGRRGGTRRGRAAPPRRAAGGARAGRMGGAHQHAEVHGALRRGAGGLARRPGGATGRPAVSRIPDAAASRPRGARRGPRGARSAGRPTQDADPVLGYGAVASQAVGRSSSRTTASCGWRCWHSSACRSSATGLPVRAVRRDRGRAAAVAGPACARTTWPSTCAARRGPSAPRHARGGAL